MPALSARPPSPPEIEYRYPPVVFLKQCEVPQIVGDTTQALVNAYIAARESLHKCNADKMTLIDWSQSKEH